PNDATMETGVSSEPDGGGAEGSVVGEASNPDGSANGVMCATNGDCQSGYCADGVCCNNACNGTCEKCSLAGTVGKCSPIPVNTDPDIECVAVVSDAGAAPVGDASPGAIDAGDSGSGTGAADASGDAG